VLLGVVLLVGLAAGGFVLSRPVALVPASASAGIGLEGGSPAHVAAVHAVANAAPERRTTIIAWQPSHQADTGADWKEYVICGDIVDRVIALLPEFTHVKAWETGMGLSGSNGYRPQPKNAPAFDSEVSQANSANAAVFISVHNDGGAPSGILGMCMPGDATSRALAERLKAALVLATKLPDRGIREERLYSLEPERNKAGTRLLLEIGDNKADRAFLLDEANRQAIAVALADSLRESDLP
jgi:hypothetical protein